MNWVSSNSEGVTWKFWLNWFGITQRWRSRVSYDPIRSFRSSFTMNIIMILIKLLAFQNIMLAGDSDWPYLIVLHDNITFRHLESSRPTIGVIRRGRAPEAWCCLINWNAARDLLSIPDFSSNSRNDMFSSWRSKSSWWPTRVYGYLSQSSPSNTNLTWPRLSLIHINYPGPSWLPPYWFVLVVYSPRPPNPPY